MQLKNIDSGLLRTIKAQLVAKGKSEEESSKTAEKLLPQAREIFTAAYTSDRQAGRLDDLKRITFAMRDVTTWAREL